MKDILLTGCVQRDLLGSDLMLRQDGAAHVLEFSGSSEYPVERMWGTEVLAHSAENIKLDRASSGVMSLLFNHNVNDPVGTVLSVQVKDGKTRVTAQFHETARGQEVRKMVEGGLRGVSVGYMLHTVEENVDKNIYTATAWEPYEFSLVTVPADPTVGVGRSAGEGVVQVRVIPGIDQSADNAKTRKVLVMTEEVKDEASAGKSAETKNVSALEAEKQRRQAIIDICAANKIDIRAQNKWIEDGTRLEVVAKELLDVMQERGKTLADSAGALGMTRKETDKYSVFKAIRAMHFGSRDRKFIDEAGFELECSRAIAQKLGREMTTSILIPADVLSRALPSEQMQRAMSVVPGAKGGYLVNVENMGFIEILRNRSAAMAMGARVLPGLQGNVVFPRQTGKVSVTWQAGEGTSVTAADQALGQLSMTPKTAIAITDVSEQLLRQSSISAEAFVMADLARDIAIDGVDNAVFNGTGGAQPLGIKNTPGVTTGQDASSATYAKILAFVSTAGSANAIRGNPGWVTNTAGAAKLMTVQRFTSTDTPVWEGNMLDGTLVGFKAMSTEQLASANLIFGSFDEVVIGEWGVLELATDTGGTRFNQAQVGIRAMWMVDVMIRYPQAFVVSTNLS